MCVFVCRWVGRCCLSSCCVVRTDSSRSTERWDDKADDCLLPPPLSVSLSLSVSPLLFLVIPPNHFQLACHSDRLPLPCVIRPWRFPGHFSGYGKCVSVSSTLSHWQTVLFHVFVRLFYNFTNSSWLYQANPSLVIVILQLAV